jgi:hypothetical protein
VALPSVDRLGHGWPPCGGFAPVTGADVLARHVSRKSMAQIAAWCTV